MFSACGRYRPRLERHFGSAGPLYAVIGVNPSDAGVDNNDQSTKKLIGFVSRAGGRGYLLGNLSDYISTDVRGLAQAVALIGPECDNQIDMIIYQADILLPIWGALAKMPPLLRERAMSVMSRLRASGKPVMCLGLTKCGQPRHPARLGYDTSMVRL